MADTSHVKDRALTEVLEENFGANSTYVESLLDRYLASPTLVDESWRTYFSDLLAGRAPSIASSNSSSTQLGTAQPNGSASPQSNGQPISTILEGASPAGSNGSGPTVGEAPRASAANGAEAGYAADQIQKLSGGAKKIVENMEVSLSVPTATSQRYVPVKLLDENRRLINRYLESQSRSKASYTHIVAFAIIKALKLFPRMNDGFAVVGGVASRIRRDDINLGLAIDIQRKDGSRTLLVPSLKRSQTLNFNEFLNLYDDIVKRARNGKLEVSDFEGTTVSLTNPGTIGTVGSVPRLMAGQSVIVATGAIEYPAEYQAMSPEALSQIGISKVVQITSTYDHRIIQGAESGMLLAKIHEFLIGQHNFYEEIFTDLRIPNLPMHWATDSNPVLLGGDRHLLQMEKQAKVLELINAYRVRGHLIADTDPLHAINVQYHPELDMESYGLTIWDLDREFITSGLGGVRTATLRTILDMLHKAYCGSVGIEYRHITSKEEKTWLRQRIETDPQPLTTEMRRQLLHKLIEAEQYEQYLHKNFLGQKRFSVEGSETVIAVLDQLIERSAERGVSEIVLGMAHRGRLNVLCNVLGNFAERIFTIFEGSVHPSFPADEGDVKYHQGAFAVRDARIGRKVNLTLSPNPSHLEFVDPVVEGMVRAKQDKLEGELDERLNRVLPVLMHGDAAFAGQGIVMETLNLASLKGYRTGGTVHLIVNNQIGFTTSPAASRSTIYSTDVAKMTQMPIFHINGDDPDAALRTLEIALEYRQTFHKDVCLDVIGFRRLGHNEADEPSYTQPLMYAKVKAHPGVRVHYANRLVREKVVTQEEVDAMIAEVNGVYREAHNKAKQVVEKLGATKGLPQNQQPFAAEESDGSEVIDTAISGATIDQITEKVSILPEDFHLNPKMVGQLARRQKMGEGAAPADWAFGESLAFGSLVMEGRSVRLSGQDSGRGTFSQRHAILYDTVTGNPWIPLSLIRSEANPMAGFYVFDSSLSEQGVLGFEYGYSVMAEGDLVMWEAQFGDFANVAQTIIDQFIASGEDKWNQKSRLVMLLPHGYEGQGPEHSSARLERFLNLCAEDNMQVAYPTTPAQYFHLLRRQVKQDSKKPLVVMTPKSLLRLPAASSMREEFMTGGFQPVLDDHFIQDREKVERVVLSSGKVYYDLLDRRNETKEERVALVRLEQFYPWPKSALQQIVASYPNVRELTWAQEEPKNMGGWIFVNPRLADLFPEFPPRYVGRMRGASPATGSYAVHEKEQNQIVSTALGF